MDDNSFGKEWLSAVRGVGRYSLEWPEAGYRREKGLQVSNKEPLKLDILNTSRKE